MPHTAEYGSKIANDNPSIRSVIETTNRAMIGGKLREVELYHRTAGYVPAGSAMIYRNEHFGFTWNDGRANHGQSFKTIEDARARFDAISKLSK
jgi:hypothetical protein